MEKIGYIERDKISLKNGLNFTNELKDIEIKYGDRDSIELRDDVIQPICAGVIMTKDNYILTISKNKKYISEKSPEKNKTLLYIGGHLDISDVSSSNLQTFANGMKREILEETGFVVEDNKLHNPILTYSSTTEKSSKHLGIIFPVVIDNCFDTTFIDGKCEFVKIDSLEEIENFESWSEIIYNEIVKNMSFVY